MKKVLVLLLSLMLLTITAHAESVESIDILNMDTEDLVALKSQIEAILTERNAQDEDLMLSGRYEVGVDIAAGKYNFYLKDDSTISQIHVYPSKEDMDTKTNGEFYFSHDDEPAYIPLEDGQWIAVYDTHVVAPVRKASYAP